MAENLQPCCETALATWLERIDKTVSSYPVIQDRPCPTCRRIVKIRVYGPPEAVGSRQ